MHRKCLIADRSVDRIRALRSKPTGLDGLREVDTNLDEGSLMVGYHHALRRVEGEILQATPDVDAM